MDESKAVEISMLSPVDGDWLRSVSTKLIYVAKSDQERNSLYLIGIRCFPNQSQMGRSVQQKGVIHRYLMKRLGRFLK